MMMVSDAIYLKINVADGYFTVQEQILMMSSELEAVMIWSNNGSAIKY